MFSDRGHVSVFTAMLGRIQLDVESYLSLVGLTERKAWTMSALMELSGLSWINTKICSSFSRLMKLPNQDLLANLQKSKFLICDRLLPSTNKLANKIFGPGCDIFSNWVIMTDLTQRTVYHCIVIGENPNSEEKTFDILCHTKHTYIFIIIVIIIHFIYVGSFSGYSKTLHK